MPSHWVWSHLSPPPLWEYILRSLINPNAHWLFSCNFLLTKSFPPFNQIINFYTPNYTSLTYFPGVGGEPISYNPDMFWVWGSPMFPTFLLTHYPPLEEMGPDNQSKSQMMGSHGLLISALDSILPGWTSNLRAESGMQTAFAQGSLH